jgi:hypothetical protein
VKPAIHRVVVERRAVLELVIETEARHLTDRAEVTEVKRANVFPRHRIAIELIVSSIDVVFACDLIRREEVSP